MTRASATGLLRSILRPWRCNPEPVWGQKFRGRQVSGGDTDAPFTGLCCYPCSRLLSSVASPVLHNVHRVPAECVRCRAYSFESWKTAMLTFANMNSNLKALEAKKSLALSSYGPAVAKFLGAPPPDPYLVSLRPPKCRPSASIGPKRPKAQIYRP